jgi:hypothetical protein
VAQFFAVKIASSSGVGRRSSAQKPVISAKISETPSAMWTLMMAQSNYNFAAINA